MKRLCVFCGSSSGKDKKYNELAFHLGETIAEKNWGLVYGGASIGVMGATANGCLSKSGEVVGVIPQSIIELEVGHQELSNLIVVDSMHERKQKMYDLSDAFVSLPGGFGTLDETCEILTWCQLKYHQKPVYLLNQDGFYDYLLQHFESTLEQGFLSKSHFDLVRVVKSVEELFLDLGKELS